MFVLYCDASEDNSGFLLIAASRDRAKLEEKLNNITVSQADYNDKMQRYSKDCGEYHAKQAKAVGEFLENNINAIKVPEDIYGNSSFIGEWDKLDDKCRSKSFLRMKQGQVIGSVVANYYSYFQKGVDPSVLKNYINFDLLDEPLLQLEPYHWEMPKLDRWYAIELLRIDEVEEI